MMSNDFAEDWRNEKGISVKEGIHKWTDPAPDINFEGLKIQGFFS